jgi:hypothetical protein
MVEKETIRILLFFENRVVIFICGYEYIRQGLTVITTSLDDWWIRVAF